MAYTLWAPHDLVPSVSEASINRNFYFKQCKLTLSDFSEKIYNLLNEIAHSRNNAPSLGVELVCGAVAHTVALVLPGMELDLPDLLSAH